MSNRIYLIYPSVIGLMTKKTRNLNLVIYFLNVLFHDNVILHNVRFFLSIFHSKNQRNVCLKYFCKKIKMFIGCEVLLYGTVSSKRNNDVILVYQHCDPNLLPAVIQR